MKLALFNESVSNESSLRISDHGGELWYSEDRDMLFIKRQSYFDSYYITYFFEDCFGDLSNYEFLLNHGASDVIYIGEL